MGPSRSVPLHPSQDPLFHPYHYYHITHYYYYLVLFHFHYSLLLLLLMTCHLSLHQRHSRLYNVTRLLYILGQSLSTFFSIVLTKTFAVETSTFLSVSSLLRDCSKNLPSSTYIWVTSSQYIQCHIYKLNLHY